MELTVQTGAFWIFAILGIAGALGLILNRNTVYAALCLILNFFSIAGLYLSLSAEFLTAIQILVYAGAIMVLFLFVIMLLNLEQEHGVLEIDVTWGFAFILGIAFIAEMLVAFQGFVKKPVNGAFDYGKVEPIGRSLMTNYLFPFEIISVVLLAALIGAIVVARKHTYAE